MEKKLERLVYRVALFLSEVTVFLRRSQPLSPSLSLSRSKMLITLGITTSEPKGERSAEAGDPRRMYIHTTLASSALFPFSPLRHTHALFSQRFHFYGSSFRYYVWMKPKKE